MDLAQTFEAWRALMLDQEATWWQEFYVRFYQAFIEADRWQQYLEGVGAPIVGDEHKRRRRKIKKRGKKGARLAKAAPPVSAH